EQPGGLYIGARRNAENGNYYWRITPWVMPCFTMIPPRGDHPMRGHFWIPIDDENCWAWSYDFHPVRALTRREVDAMRDGAGVHCKYTPGGYRPLANKDNDYLIDRAAQKAGKTFSGVAGFAMQDASLQESMGPICDRTKENLVSTDNGIIMARHRLMRAVKALVEKGITPPGVDPTHHKVRSASVVLPPDQAFKDAAKEALTTRPGVAQTTVEQTEDRGPELGGTSSLVRDLSFAAMAELKLKTVTRSQGNNRALKDDTVKPRTFIFDFEEVDPLIAAFRRMVRGNEFDICEMAITTYICAKAHGKPMTAVPVFLVRAFHHGAILVNAKAGIRTLKDLEGKKIGVNRGYTVTTGVWARSILQDEHGVDLSKVTWVLSGDEHVAEYRAPKNVVPIEKGKMMGDMLASGELAAAIGVDVKSPDVKPLIPNALEAGLAALRQRGHYPINHL